MIHNGIPYGAKLCAALERAAGMAVDEEGVSRLGETITPIIDIWSKPEWALLREEHIWGNGASFQGAVAGQISVVGIRNPAGSGRVAVIEKLMVDVNGTSLRIGNNADYTPASISTVVSRDPRVVPINNIPIQSTQSTVVVLTGGVIYRWSGAGSVGAWLDVDVVLMPGTYAHVDPNTVVNTALNVCFKGRDRLLLPGEVSGF